MGARSRPPCIMCLQETHGTIVRNAEMEAARVAEKRGNRSHNTMMMYRKRHKALMSEHGTDVREWKPNDLRKLADVRFARGEMRRNTETLRRDARAHRMRATWHGNIAAFWGRVG